MWGLPPSLLLAVVDLIHPGNGCHAVARPCRCKLKTAIVPVAGVQRWRAALTGGIITGGNITGHWRYLGAAAASPHPGLGPYVGAWPATAVGTVQSLSWAPGLAKAASRAGAVAALRGSFGLRAAEWNMYVAPLVTYPANISAPPPAARAQLDRLAAAAFRTRGWAPSAVASALGAVFKIRGAPRDLYTASRAGALRAFIHGTSWGPPPTPSGPPAWLRAMRHGGPR